MNNVMDAFYWRSAIMAILVVLAVAGAMLLRLFRAWRRRNGSRGRPAGERLSAKRRDPGSDVAAEPFARRTTLARMSDVPVRGRDDRLRDAA
jgi:hypothetical protein